LIKKQNILKLYSIFFVVIFLVSITPKSFLHSLFDAHAHKVVQTSATENHPNFKAQSIHCDCNNFTAITPFLNDFFVYEQQPLSAYFIYSEVILSHTFSKSFAQIDLRGPPQYLYFL
jgi:hypothetical protein